MSARKAPKMLPDEVPGVIRRRVTETTVRALQLADDAWAVGHAYEQLSTAISVLADDQTSDGAVFSAWDEASGLTRLYEVIHSLQVMLYANGRNRPPLDTGDMRKMLEEMEAEQ